VNPVIDLLAPQEVWEKFSAISKIPRGSGKEQQLVDYIENLATQYNLSYTRDQIGNIVVYKSGSPLLQGEETIVLQSHLDMVQVKEDGLDFDFDHDAINLYVDGDWLKAKGTTLGADNGIGVAMALALLCSTHIPHPNLELLFTVCEEIGMVGAKQLSETWLKGKVMINLDTEHDDQFTLGCAGSVDLSVSKTYTSVAIHGKVAYEITVSGLKGGHSGLNIHCKVGNASKVMAELLLEISRKTDLAIHALSDGNVRNTIPSISKAVVFVAPHEVDILFSCIEDLKEKFIKRIGKNADNLSIRAVEKKNVEQKVLPNKIQKDLLECIYRLPDGVYNTSSQFADVVETSSNLSILDVGAGRLYIHILVRSLKDSELARVSASLRAYFHQYHFEMQEVGFYPAWEAVAESMILDIAKNVYARLFNEQPRTTAYHAGLECGMIKSKYPHLDVISMGPKIESVHSCNERVAISSVKKSFDLLVGILGYKHT